MKTLSIREARQALSRLEEILQTEGEIAITKRGRPVARVLHLGSKKPVPSHKALRQKMAPLRKDSGVLVREDRDAR